jgi:sugar-phosphatase
MLKAAIFDMDGLLIDSEPFWKTAEKAVFPLVNIHLTTAMCETTMGLRLDEVVAHWYKQMPWDENIYAKTQIADLILAEVTRLIKTEGVALAGVYETLELCRKSGLKLALASSSSLLLIQAVLERLALENTFEVVSSAEFEEFGKPHPAVFISTAKKLDVHPTECLVFEDSFFGTIAAKAARMSVVVVPDSTQYAQERFVIADAKLHSLTQFTEEVLNRLNNPTF